MTEPRQPQSPTAEAARTGEITGGNRGALSGRDDEQSRAIGQNDPVGEGSRQGRERHKEDLDKDTAWKSGESV